MFPDRTGQKSFLLLAGCLVAVAGSPALAQKPARADGKKVSSGSRALPVMPVVSTTPAATMPATTTVITIEKRDVEPRPELTGVKTVDVSKPYGYHLGPILDRVNAETDQRDRITMVFNSYRNRIEPLRQELKIKQQDLLGSLFRGEKAESIMCKQMELGRINSQLIEQYTLMNLEIRRQLKPEQISPYEEYRHKQGWR